MRHLTQPLVLSVKRVDTHVSLWIGFPLVIPHPLDQGKFDLGRSLGPVLRPIRQSAVSQWETLIIVLDLSLIHI